MQFQADAQRRKVSAKYETFLARASDEIAQVEAIKIVALASRDRFQEK